MIRITALNEETDEESGSEEEVTKEALEEIALQQYAKTLELQKKGNLKDALQLLKDLLDTELLDKVQKPEVKENVSRPLLNLKYLCYRNVASLSAQLGDKEAAVEAYLEASSLDDSDVTLWFRLGKLSLQCEKYDLALFAFQRGVDCNSKHWPCLDNLIIVLLGLGEYNACISNIYFAFERDPEYLRGRAYRKHIFTEYPYIREYLSVINPIYKWTPDIDVHICGKEYDSLISEAISINEIYTKQILASRVVSRLPVLSLRKPILLLTWLSVGESLTDMHKHMSDNMLSHACVVTMRQTDDKAVADSATEAEPMEVDASELNATVEDVERPTDEKMETETEKVVSENEDADKAVNDNEKTDVEVDNAQVQDANKSSNEGKDAKKNVGRRRGSSLSFLEQWEWCNKRRSSRKKTSNRTDRVDDTIYDALKRLLPQNLLSDELKQEKVKEFNGEDSLDTMDLYKLFEEKEKTASNSLPVFSDSDPEANEKYFNTEKEEKDVQAFIDKYVESPADIITTLDEFLVILSNLWETTWPPTLGDIYMTANLCAKQHFDPPLGYTDDELLKTFVNINLLHLELGVSKMTDDPTCKGIVDPDLVDLMRVLCSRKKSFGSDDFNITLRYLWVKCHALLLDDEMEFALDCLYYILDEFDHSGEKGNAYSLRIPNFLKSSIISKNSAIELLKSLERNKHLATVLTLYNTGKYEEVLPILQDSFKHCQLQASKREWSAMALDWAGHLVTLLETLWALDNTEECFTWAVRCLHEALKQFSMTLPGNFEYNKWSLTVMKILVSLEHILKREGGTLLNILPEKVIARFVQDIVQIIVHQLDEANGAQDMPIDTVVPWIILHFIFQREEDCGRIKKPQPDEEPSEKEEIPSSLMILFLGHDYLGKKGWCCNNNGHLLYFTLNAVIPRLRSPALSSVVEAVSQYLEQNIFCLFGHPSKKTKLRYLVDHNVIPFKINWKQSEQIFELYRPEEMPEFNSYRLGSITAETEQLFLRMLTLLPGACDPQPYISEVISYIESKKDKLPDVNINLPYKMRDIYYLLADFYLKNNETVKALKYYAYDIVISKNRFDSWAGMALARGSLLETKLNSCETFKTEMEYLTRAAAVERCFKKALQIDSSHSMLWIEYGAFVYGVHSFCSRMLKQASESLSMESFEVLENRKENMLDTSHKCFVSAHKEWMSEFETEDKGPQDERWLHYYMLGKISEKKNEPPNVYLDHYTKAGKFLQQNNATYPTKINYNNPQNLSVEALEIHYRIHASILKYMEQHENKTISMADGKAFKNCLAQCSTGPFSLNKKVVKDSLPEKDAPAVPVIDDTATPEKTTSEVSEQPTLGKRAADDEANNLEVKKVKLNDTVTLEKTPDGPSESTTQPAATSSEVPLATKNVTVESVNDDIITVPNTSNLAEIANDKEPTVIENVPNEIAETPNSVESTKSVPNDEAKNVIENANGANVQGDSKVIPVVEKVSEVTKANTVKVAETEVRRTSQESATTNTVTSRENSSSSSSSSSSSDDSSSESSSDSSADSVEEKTTSQKNAPREMITEDIEEVIKMCLDGLEDCVSRFPQHYKAIYRLAHYHFYYKKDKNVERCRDLMLSFITGRAGSKLQGLFCERKNSNFFNGIWRIPASEVDRPGSFASHMSRCVLITMEVLKEIDDHKTLLDLCLQLQRTPDAEKKYLRDSERGELSQQAFSLCIRSLKAQLAKFNTRPDFSANQPEKKTLSGLMLDIYRAYQKVQKHVAPKSQQFSVLLVECYKLSTGNSIVSEPSNLLDLSVKHCQSLILASKQQAQAAIVANAAAQTANSAPVSVPAKRVAQPKPAIIPASSFLPNAEPLPTYPKNPYQANPYGSYMPVIDPNLLSALSNFDQAAATLSYVSNMESLAGLAGMTGSSYQTDLIRQYIATSLDNAYLQQMKPVYNQSTNNSKVKSVNAGKNSKMPNQQAPPRQQTPSSFVKYPIKHKTPPKNPQPFTNFNQSKYVLKKQTQGDVMRSVLNQSNLASSSVNTVPAPPKMFTMVPGDPGPAKTAHSPVSHTPTSSGAAKPAHMVTTSTVSAALHTKPPMPHQQVSPGKTLQEKLAERQKQNPGVSKTGSATNETPAYSGKIPSSLTITKANIVPGKANEDTVQVSNESFLKPVVRDIKKSLQFNTSEQLARPKNIIDTSEVIVLDDD